MASTIISNLAFLLALLSLTPSAVNASWKMVANTVVTGRVDPLINPGTVSGVSPISTPSVMPSWRTILPSHALTLFHSMCMIMSVGITLVSRTTTMTCEQVHVHPSRFKRTRVDTGLPRSITARETGARTSSSNPLTWSIIFIVAPTKRLSPKGFG